MKTYCSNCGTGIDYSFKEPETCPSCFKNIKAGISVNVTKPISTKPKNDEISGEELERFLNKTKKSKNRRRHDEGDDDFDDEDEDNEEDDFEEDEDVDDEEERPRRRSDRYNRQSREEGLFDDMLANIQPIKKMTLGELGSMPPAKAEPRPVSKEKFSKTKFREQFKKENVDVKIPNRKGE